MEIPYNVFFGTAATLFGALVALCTTYIFFRELPRWGMLRKAITYFTISAAFFAVMGLDFAVIYGLSMTSSVLTFLSYVLYSGGLLFTLLGALEIAKCSALFRFEGAEPAAAKKKPRKSRKRRK